MGEFFSILEPNWPVGHSVYLSSIKLARGRKLSDLANAEPNTEIAAKIAVRLAWTKCGKTSESDPSVRIQH